MPRLEDRREDIRLLQQFRKKDCKDKHFTDEVMAMLFDYDWPGNARQMKQVVERCALLTDGSTLAAVGGLADEVKGELAKAYVLIKPGAEVTRDALIGFCREHMAAYKVPRAIQFVSQVPMTSSGKIMRRLLKDLDDGTR